MSEDKLSVDKEKIENIQKGLDIIDNDLERLDELQEIRLRLGAIEGEAKELREEVKKLKKQLKDQYVDTQRAVVEATQPLIDMIESLKKDWAGKQIVNTTESFTAWIKRVILRK